MLNLIRDNVQSFGVKFIVGIVAVVMGAFGITAYRSQSVNTIATIGDYEIKVEKYQRAFEQAQEEIRRRYQDRAAEYMKMVNLPAQIVQQLVNTVLLLKSASKNGLAVSDRELAQAIYQNTAFQTDGRFDQKKYTRMLENNRLEKLVYEKDLRENLLTQKFFRFLSAGALYSRQFLEKEHRRYRTEMEIKVLEITPELFTDTVKLSKSEIQSYYDMHKVEFQQKSQFALKYFVLGTDDVKDKIKVRKKEIEKYYRKNKKTEFSSKDSFLSRHILISVPKDRTAKDLEKAKKKADGVYFKLVADRKKFPDLAEKNSDDPASARKGGDLGWVEKGTFVQEFEQTVDKLKKNELSKPFLSDFGYHIVEVLDKRSSRTQPMAEVRQEITEKIRLGKAGRRLKNRVANLTKNMAEKSLEEMAASTGKKIQSTKAFDDSASLPELGYSYRLYQALKSKKVHDKGYHSLPGDKGTLIYQVEKTMDPFIKPLKEVTGSIEYLAKREKARRVAKEKLVEYSRSVGTLKQFDALAAKLKTDAKQVKFKFSDPQIEQLRVGENFRTEVFGMNKNQVKPISESNRDFLVYLLDKSQGSADQDNDDNFKALENQLQRQKIQVILNGLVQQMNAEMKVEYNTSILNALNIQLNK
ncbi:MAG: hypothetical protein GY866_26720 [Proteobacteria bacterium]|nr:hypothetical protein [Pseudomonadota bacterium]